MPKQKQTKPQCIICNTNEFKYICPYCPTVLYCSLTCYKRHQRFGCAKPTTTDDNNTDHNSTNNNNTNTLAKQYEYVQPIQPDPSIPKRQANSDILTEHDYYAIQCNRSLIHKLQSNPELQTIIRNTDGAYDRSQTLEKYRTNNTDFNIFVNELLQCIDTQ